MLAVLCSAFVLMVQEVDYVLPQNQPTQSGFLVTFKINAADTINVPFIAWDFGDGSGLGRYKRSLTATHRYNEPGVYQVFARIQGEDIPLTVAQTIYNPATNPKPTRSSTIVVDTVHKVVWTVNPDNNSVSRIDMETNQLLEEVQAGIHPRTLALHESGAVWVANEDEATVSIVSTTGQVVQKIDLPRASRPYGICFDPQYDYCYVSLQGTGELVKIEVATKEVVDKIDVGRAPRGIAVTTDGYTVLVTQFISEKTHGTVRVIDAPSMSVSKEIVLAFDETPDFEDRGRGVPNYLSSITISPDGSEAWVPCKKDNTARGVFRDGQKLTFDNTVRTIVARIDMNTLEEITDMRTDINDAEMASAVEFSPYGNLAFVALQGNNKIIMIHVPTNARMGLLDSVGRAPQGLMFNREGTRLYVQNFMSRTVGVLNTEDIILSNNFASNIETRIGTVEEERLSEEVLRGKQIFYNAEDTRMTFAGYISCASCHLDGGSDERVWDFTGRGEGLRNTHSLLGRGGMRMGNVHWTSNFDEIQDFENDIRNGFRGSGFLPDSVFNSGTISDPLGDPKAGLSADLDALAAYVSSLEEVHPSPYRAEDGSLTSDGIAGKKIFAQVGCGNCHSGPDFTDRSEGQFHDVGTAKISSGTRRNENITGFGTPTLKGIWETAPYLHDGSAPTLRDVLVEQNKNSEHGDLSGLTDTEIDQLVAYLLQIDETNDDVVSMAWDFNKEVGSSLTISPNPATDYVKVTLPNSNKPKGTLRIYSLDGRSELHRIEVNGEKTISLNVDYLKPGAYIISYSGKVVSTNTLVVTK